MIKRGKGEKSKCGRESGGGGRGIMLPPALGRKREGRGGEGGEGGSGGEEEKKDRGKSKEC